MPDFQKGNKMKLLNILHIVHHERSGVRSNSHTFPRPVFPYFDEHHLPCGASKHLNSREPGEAAE